MIGKKQDTEFFHFGVQKAKSRMSKAEANLIGLQNNSSCLLQINFTFRFIGETPTAVNKNYAHPELFVTNPIAHSISAC